ncbi:MAG TPA: hypothetical protein VHZ76_00775 [Gammaproteobacteria bacterium]|jgi:phage tail tape-measure protein|nr:hypothetical protein [Gammaproteobacteria bacterium]
MARSASNISNFNQLRESLGETLDGLLSGKVDVDTANAVSRVSDSITQTINAELNYTAKTGAVTVIDFLEQREMAKKDKKKALEKLR